MSHFQPSMALPYMKAISLSSFLLVCFGLAACSGEAEVFSQTEAALQEHVGEQCTIDPLPTVGEVTVEESATCGSAVCLGVEGQAYCSCRCSGPESAGPLCSCAEGFHCQDELIEDLGLSGPYAGGYCVRNE